ncbi:MAG: hypothetical protein AB1480_07815 [Nitrospirota bacterium]
MKYIDLKNALKDFTVFSLRDIKGIDSDFFRARLNEWQNKGYIRKIVKGYYIFTDLKLSENVLFEIANKIYSPSYISFETALFYYNLIPESVYGITSASTRRTYDFKSQIAEFSYRTIKPDLFFGYNIIGYNNKHFKIAGVEKAVLDYFYVRPDMKTEDDFAGMRINSDLFLKQINEDNLQEFLERFAKRTLAKRVNLLLKFIRNA